MTANTPIIPVILCGGAGRRLHPLSRLNRPKQFFRLKGKGHTLFQDTVLRYQNFAAPIIVTADHYKQDVSVQLKAINVEPLVILSEPLARNTGPAIAMALNYLQTENIKDHQLLILPCDHIVDDVSTFHGAIQNAQNAAKDHLVLFGIEPRLASPHFGYIQVDEQSNDSPLEVLSFKEKPRVSLAESYLEQGGYYWNSGVFLMGYYVALEAYREYAPALWYQMQNIDPLNVQEQQYRALEARGFDKLILEYASNIKMQHCDMFWADIGSWPMFIKHISRFHLFK